MLEMGSPVGGGVLLLSLDVGSSVSVRATSTDQYRMTCSRGCSDPRNKLFRRR